MNQKINFSKWFQPQNLSLNGWLVIILFVSFFLLVRQCGQTKEAIFEGNRKYQNLLASQDSVRIIKTEKDKILFEKSAMELKLSELSKEQKNLIKSLELSEKLRKKSPKTIVKYVTEYKDSIRNIPTEIKKSSIGKEEISFVYSPKLPGENFLKVSGSLPYSLTLKEDSLKKSRYVPILNVGNASLIISQKIEIRSGIFRDPDTKRIMTRVSTSYPGISFSDINSFNITDDSETKKILRKSRKEFGVGLMLGVGISPTNLRRTLIIGAGITYSPRFLQFGK